jgi:hypothetical protein
VRTWDAAGADAEVSRACQTGDDPGLRGIDGRDDQDELSTGPLQVRGPSVHGCRISTVTRYTYRYTAEKTMVRHRAARA